MTENLAQKIGAGIATIALVANTYANAPKTPEVPSYLYGPTKTVLEYQRVPAMTEIKAKIIPPGISESKLQAVGVTIMPSESKRGHVADTTVVTRGQGLIKVRESKTVKEQPVYQSHENRRSNVLKPYYIKWQNDAGIEKMIGGGLEISFRIENNNLVINSKRNYDGNEVEIIKDLRLGKDPKFQYNARDILDKSESDLIKGIMRKREKELDIRLKSDLTAYLNKEKEEKVSKEETERLEARKYLQEILDSYADNSRPLAARV